MARSAAINQTAINSELRYGRWVVIGPAAAGKALCRCDCGTVKAVATKTLSNTTSMGKSTSCGCVRRETVAARNYKHGDSPRNGRSKEYRAWCHMHERCSNPSCEKYNRYGGRGIRVCDRWSGEDGYRHFLEDLGRAPKIAYSIERVDQDGDYCKANCQWDNAVTQGNNTCRNVYVEYHNVRMTVSEVARELSVNRSHLSKLLKSGLSLNEALRRVSKDTRLNYQPKEGLR